MPTIQEVAESAYEEWSSMNGAPSFRVWLRVAFQQELEKILSDMARREISDCVKDINFHTLANKYVEESFAEKFDEVMKEEIRRQADGAVKEALLTQVRAEISEIRAKAISMARKSVKSVLAKMDGLGA